MAVPEEHISVMLDEVIHGLAPFDGGVYVDGTFGAGGYSEAILKLAKCNYELGMIQFKENNISNATSLYHKALLLDPNASTFP